MTPKIRSVRPMLDKLKEALATDVNKLADRIAETDAMRVATFKASNASLDGAQADLKEVRDYLEDLSKSNGGDPLDGYEEQSSESNDQQQSNDKQPQSNIIAHPRSSEVASR